MKTLRDAKVGDTVTVVKLHGEGALKRRVMDMGITKGVEIYVRKVAPLGDPVEITVRGYELSIRRSDAEIIEVEEASKVAERSVSVASSPVASAVSQSSDDSREIKIALAGDPNCGKTTLFNELTGGSQYVGNWPGVTVEKKEGRLKGRRNVIIQDLPGIYSLSPYSPEEVVTRTYLVEERPDAVIDIIDGTNLERNLYLTTQLLELGIPTVVAVNMMDIVRKNGDDIDFGRLSLELQCPVVPISALTGEGVHEVAAKAVELAHGGETAPRPHVFTGSVEHAIAHIEESIQGKVPEQSIRWHAIKIFERDEKAVAGLGFDSELLAHLNEHVAECEKEMDDDSVSIVIDQRYARVKEVTDRAFRRRIGRGQLTLSDKIDRVVTNRVLALPIFAAVIWLMYYISVTTVGSWMTDWANDGVFGEAGWHLTWPTSAKAIAWKEDTAEFMAAQARIEAFESAGDENATRLFRVEDEETGEVTNYPVALDEFLVAKFTDADSFSAIAREDIVALFEEDGTPKDAKLEGITLVTEGGEPALRVAGEDGEEAAVFPFSAFIADRTSAEAARAVSEPDPADSAKYGLWFRSLPAITATWFSRIGVAEDSWLHKLVFDVIFGGVGTILGFVPQIIVIFLFLGFLEDVGYMARVAFIMDRIFHKFGLSGKSFIPILVGMGCGVPAILATRTIEAQRDRRMTIMLGTYIPCGAKAAIIAMFVPAFFSRSAWVASAMYFSGIGVIVLGGLILKKFQAFAGDPAPFVMELPAYHLPTFYGIVRHTWDRTKAYMIKAGTIIFAACTVLWILMHFSWTLSYVGAALDQSILASIGNVLKWIFAPLGFGQDWAGAVASVVAEAAKEQAPATLAMVAGNQPVAGGTLPHLRALFMQLNGVGLGTLAALSFMLFNLFNPPCMVAIATAFREMGSAKWGWICVGFQFLVGYCLALVVYQIGALFIGGQFGFWTIVAFALVVAALYLVFRPMPKE
ncbi:MAG: fused ferrous iron transport protein A/B [Victivallales bacterium]|nr:fused ferrous iron transport protein A/B [Victivallales bacterium]